MHPKIRYYDPTGEKQEFNNLKNVQFKKNIKDACELSDLIIIHTEWNEFKLIDLKKVVKIPMYNDQRKTLILTFSWFLIYIERYLLIE